MRKTQDLHVVETRPLIAPATLHGELPLTETADQVAVLQADDRYHFYRILQDWAEQQGIHLRLSRKMVSKVRRR